MALAIASDSNGIATRLKRLTLARAPTHLFQREVLDKPLCLLTSCLHQIFSSCHLRKIPSRSRQIVK